MMLGGKLRHNIDEHKMVMVTITFQNIECNGMSSGH